MFAAKCIGKGAGADQPLFKERCGKNINRWWSVGWGKEESYLIPAYRMEVGSGESSG